MKSSDENDHSPSPDSELLNELFAEREALALIDAFAAMLAALAEAAALALALA